MSILYRGDAVARTRHLNAWWPLNRSQVLRDDVSNSLHIRLAIEIIHIRGFHIELVVGPEVFVILVDRYF